MGDLHFLPDRPPPERPDTWLDRRRRFWGAMRAGWPTVALVAALAALLGAGWCLAVGVEFDEAVVAVPVLVVACVVVMALLG